ncbi:hypothetical protein, partial [Pseudomonas aeruginosa]|uniref:hypothetical protein n=1 Tax=Pseudomonas aeruginosa TaxID=287 RepID=UPI00141A76A8
CLQFVVFALAGILLDQGASNTATTADLLPGRVVVSPTALCIQGAARIDFPQRPRLAFRLDQTVERGGQALVTAALRFDPLAAGAADRFVPRADAAALI